MVGGVGALYKLDGDTVIPVGTFLDWVLDDSSGQTIVYAEEIYLESWPVSPPLHCALFSGGSLFLCDSVGAPYFQDGRPLKATGDFVRGPVCLLIGFLWQRIPGFTTKQWAKTVVEDGQLLDVLKMVTQAREKSGKSVLDPFEISFESKKEPITKGA
ncbi:MAG: hypothetical protein QW793_04930 [Candidatus Caldarchaeum sp.]